MALICEECGKIYHIDKEKLRERLKNGSGKTRCRICGHIMEISNESLRDDEELDNYDFFEEDPSQEEFTDEKFPDSPPLDEKEPRLSEKPSQLIGVRKRGLGLRAKMFILFLIIPIALMAASGLFSQYQLTRLSDSITNEGIAVVKDFAEKRISEKARDVALQCEIYLQSHPEIMKEDFNYLNDFKKIAVQKIGETGYTALAERSAPTEALDNFKVWAHPDPAIVGVPLFKKIESVLVGKEVTILIETLKPLIRGEEVSGYYKWKGSDSILKEKYLVAVHVKHTKYVVIATAPIKEFTRPIKDLKKESLKLTRQTRDINILILVATLLIISIAIVVYGYKITRNIRYLTETADRISVGELDVNIRVKSKDEIGSLAEAISRMQDSLRLSIERLRKRR